MEKYCASVTRYGIPQIEIKNGNQVVHWVSTPKSLVTVPIFHAAKRRNVAIVRRVRGIVRPDVTRSDFSNPGRRARRVGYANGPLRDQPPGAAPGLAGNMQLNPVGAIHDGDNSETTGRTQPVALRGSFFPIPAMPVTQGRRRPRNRAPHGVTTRSVDFGLITGGRFCVPWWKDIRR